MIWSVLLFVGMILLAFYYFHRAIYGYGFVPVDFWNEYINDLFEEKKEEASE